MHGLSKSEQRTPPYRGKNREKYSFEKKKTTLALAKSVNRANDEAADDDGPVVEVMGTKAARDAGTPAVEGVGAMDGSLVHAPGALAPEVVVEAEVVAVPRGERERERRRVGERGRSRSLPVCATTRKTHGQLCETVFCL